MDHRSRIAAIVMASIPTLALACRGESPPAANHGGSSSSGGAGGSGAAQGVAGTAGSLGAAAGAAPTAGGGATAGASGAAGTGRSGTAGSGGMTNAGGATAAAGSMSSAGTTSSAGTMSADGNAPELGTVEDSGADCAIPAMPPAAQLTAFEKHHDPFTRLDGSRITRKDQWRCRRAEIKAQVERYESGPKPVVAADEVTAQLSGNTLSISVSSGGKSVRFSV